jgi:hypothetical protein
MEKNRYSLVLATCCRVVDGRPPSRSSMVKADGKAIKQDLGLLYPRSVPKHEAAKTSRRREVVAEQDE